uniref:Ig-like domain-containing protein n=1 Tax=Laticauda laticaudata TaxID=8630 RepID=A0A8C5S067_LATLA
GAETFKVTERDPVTLECTVSGTPELQVKWFKDGKQLMPSRFYTMSLDNNVASFRMESVVKEDSGVYSFKVENDYGSHTCEAVVTVLAIPPSFTKKLSKMNKILGSSIHMECKVSGSLPITAKWYKDGKEISDSAKYRSLCHENTVSLEINNLELTDSSNYTCSVTNIAGSDSCSAILAVKEPPSFLAKPESQEAVPDSTVEFKAVLKGTPPFKIKWFKEDLELAPGPNCVFGIEGSTGFLNLYSVDGLKSGNYICQVSNDVGSDSCTTTLIITEPPKFAKRLDPSNVVKHGDSTRLACKITETINELHDLMPFLKLRHLSIEDSGDYIYPASLFFLEPPVFSRKPSPVDTLKGTEVHLECEISGTPPFDITWYKDKRQIRSSKKYKVTSKNYLANIHILNTETSDVGEYQCKAKNDVGSDTCICTVKLKEPPKFVTKINSLTVVVGEPVELQATVEGSQPISVIWLKDKEDIIRESENTEITYMDNIATLQLAKAELSSAGKYICQVRNDAGTRECMATLTVLG